MVHQPAWSRKVGLANGWECLVREGEVDDGIT